MNIMKFIFRLVKSFLVVVILYLYIYNPPFTFLPISASKLLYIILLPYFLFNRQISKTYFTFFSKETLLLGFIISYSFIVELLNSIPNRVYSYANLYMLFENFFFAFSIAYFLFKHYKNSIDNVLLTVTGIAALITLYLIINPEINLIVRQFVLQTDDVALKMMHRSFGISDSLTFAYAIVQGIAAAICFTKIKNIFWSSLLFLLYLVSAAFNARIGMLPIFAILFYMLFVEKKYSKVLGSITCLLVLLLFFLNTKLAVDYEDTLEWITDFFTEISSLIMGTETASNSNMDILLNDMVVLPRTFGEWILGSGIDLYTSPVRNSDVGYFIQLNYGGLFYILLFALLVLFLFHKLLKYKVPEKWFTFLFIVVILTCSYKGLFLVTNPGFRMLMLLYFCYFLRTVLKYNRIRNEI